MVATVCKAKSHPLISRIEHMTVDDTPITMSRNRVMKVARDRGIDLVVMMDSDMIFDLPLPGAKPFWDSSIEFVLNHHGPCVIGAPYCGPPPIENVYVFRWANWETDSPQDSNMRLEQFTREEAAVRAGIEEVAALPTGLVIISTKCLEHLPPPWFEYEYTDEYQTTKASTEDVVFTRNLSLAGVPQYCNWDAWAGHVKRKVVTKPQLLTTDAVKEKYRKGILRNCNENERLHDIRPGDLLTRMIKTPLRLNGGGPSYLPT